MYISWKVWKITSLCEIFNLHCHAEDLSASRASKAPHSSGTPNVGAFRRGVGSHCSSARSVSWGASFRDRPLTMTNLGKNPGFQKNVGHV